MDQAVMRFRHAADRENQRARCAGATFQSLSNKRSSTRASGVVKDGLRATTAHKSISSDAQPEVCVIRAGNEESRW
jgi:hypothetical protein